MKQCIKMLCKCTKTITVHSVSDNDHHSEEKGDSRVAADALLSVGVLCAADDEVEFTTSSVHEVSPIVTISFPALI